MSKHATYLTIMLDEINGGIINGLVRLISWNKSESKLSIGRKRAIASYGWQLLKAHCWTHAEFVLLAEDIDEIAEIDGFAHALFKAGHAKKEESERENETNSDELCKDSRLVIERFSPDNIARKNKLATDAQRQVKHRRGHKDCENVTPYRDACHVNDTGIIYNNTIQSNNENIQYDTSRYNNVPSGHSYNNYSSHSSRYDKKRKSGGYGTNAPNARHRSQYADLDSYAGEAEKPSFSYTLDPPQNAEPAPVDNTPPAPDDDIGF